MSLIKQRLTAEQIEEKYGGLLMLFERGFPLKECARVAGVSRWTAQWVLHRCGWNYCTGWWKDGKRQPKRPKQ